MPPRSPGALWLNYASRLPVLAAWFIASFATGSFGMLAVVLCLGGQTGCCLVTTRAQSTLALCSEPGCKQAKETLRGQEAVVGIRSLAYD